MSDLTQSPVRIVTFADLGVEAWAAAMGGPEPLLVAIAGLEPLAVRAELDTNDERGPWRLSAPAVALELDPAAEPVQLGDDGPLTGFDQLVQVRGTVGEQDIDCLGRRGVRELEGAPVPDSIRDVSAWFEPHDGLSLTAIRPRRARGHDHDLVAAAVLDAGGPVAVAEPRLSTTYDAGGNPARMGLELWIDESGGEQQYPRRAAGEAIGPPATGAADGLELAAYPLRCHSRGSQGSGIYLIARPR